LIYFSSCSIIENYFDNRIELSAQSKIKEGDQYNITETVKITAFEAKVIALGSAKPAVFGYCSEFNADIIAKKIIDQKPSELLVNSRKNVDSIYLSFMDYEKKQLTIGDLTSFPIELKKNGSTWSGNSVKNNSPYELGKEIVADFDLITTNDFFRLNIYPYQKLEPGNSWKLSTAGIRLLRFHNRTFRIDSGLVIAKLDSAIEKNNDKLAYISFSLSGDASSNIPDDNSFIKFKLNGRIVRSVLTSVEISIEISGDVLVKSYDLLDDLIAETQINGYLDLQFKKILYKNKY
jgi:hypothetical protein